MGLTIYNPQNALERIMARRKAQPTREEKIAIALKMQQENEFRIKKVYKIC